jgi:predicted HTH transcriptional regulator
MTMSIYSKPVSWVEPSDLQELLSENAVENVRLEFKREPPSKDEMLKKLSSFANAYGGYLVVGAEASSKDGRIVGLPGVDPQPSYKQTVMQWCSGGASPPLSVEVSDPIAAPSGGDKVCYGLVPEIETTG